MGKRFGYYKIQSHVNDVWDNTLAFWQKNRGKIRDQFISANTLFRELKIRHPGSIHGYGANFGETYEMTFGFQPTENITYVSVKIKFTMGRGFYWVIPQDVMKKWARKIGVDPIKLTRKQDQTFSEKFNEICNITGRENSGHSRNFCPICGNENILKIKFCIECGTQIENLH